MPGSCHLEQTAYANSLDPCVCRYGGHFKEAGHNSIGFVKVSNCWTRNLRIINAGESKGRTMLMDS